MHLQNVNIKGLPINKKRIKIEEMMLKMVNMMMWNICGHTQNEHDLTNFDAYFNLSTKEKKA